MSWMLLSDIDIGNVCRVRCLWMNSIILTVTKVIVFLCCTVKLWSCLWCNQYQRKINAAFHKTEIQRIPKSKYLEFLCMFTQRYLSFLNWLVTALAKLIFFKMDWDSYFGGRRMNFGFFPCLMDELIFNIIVHWCLKLPESDSKKVVPILKVK